MQNPQLKPIDAPTSPLAPSADELIAKLPKVGPTEAQKVLPKNPSQLVGLGIYDLESRYIGAVSKVSSLPALDPKEDKLSVTIIGKDGKLQTFDWAQVEWRGKAKTNVPEFGVLQASFPK